ncbi:hypothetical protein [Brevibacillus sp. SAFN-007a]|uniref:hypothetical protein n=1 Tax=Brevibacillus sp. SAFN-007a TaxID=3436862 RepID=UPI003F81E37A
MVYLRTIKLLREQFPDAGRYPFDESPIQPIRYRDTEHYQLTRRFLEKPDAFFRE